MHVKHVAHRLIPGEARETAVIIFTFITTAIAITIITLTNCSLSRFY